MDSFISWWNHLPENINPIFIQLGSFQIRWYGLMYMTAFVVAYLIAASRIKKEKLGFTVEQLDHLCLWGMIGILLGARLGYVVFYNFAYYAEYPLEIFLPFSFRNGLEYVGITGLSYHGGLLGLAVAVWFFCRKLSIPFWKFGDLLTTAAPLGYTFGRIGNFLNNELYGRVTTVPWGMYFPTAPTYELRHPSQLYEAFFEGIFLFMIVWALRKHNRQDGFLLSIYLIGYGLVRFVIEFFRQPDEHLGLVWSSLSMGQIFCLAMIAIGAVLMLIKGKRATA